MATTIFFWTLAGILIIIEIILLISYIIENKRNKKIKVIDWSPKESEKEQSEVSYEESHPSFESNSEVHAIQDPYTFNFGLPQQIKVKPKDDALNKKRKYFRDNFLEEISSYTYNTTGMQILLARARKMLKNPTVGEKILYEFLAKNNIKYFPQQIVCCSRSYILDAYLPDYHIDIEVDGGYHFTQQQKTLDKERSDDLFNTFHIKTIRLINRQLETGYFATKLQKFLEQNKIE